MGLGKIFMIFETKDDFNLLKTAECGQCFRFNQTGRNTFRTIAFNRVLDMNQSDPTHIEFSCDEKEFESIWKDYFDIDTNYSDIRSKIKDDPFLYECSLYGKGLRILKQDIWETVISFIISQRKSIPAIKTSVERLCELCGNQINDNCFAFPSPAQILSQDIDNLAACGLGYRLEYILEASRIFDDNPSLIPSLELLDDESLFNELKSIKGIGDKVASCIALFGFHRLNFFPKDVWINRALADKYPNGFDMKLYEPFNGVIQQYIFYGYKNR